VLTNGGPVRVFEDQASGGTLVVNSYTVVLSRAPEESVTVFAVPVAITESALRAGGKGVALNTVNTLAGASENGVPLIFTRNDWFKPQTVYVFAPADALAEGTNGYTIVHRTQEGSSAKDGGAYDGLAVLGVVATVVDDDAAQVLVAAYDNTGTGVPIFSPIVAEGGTSDVAGPADPVSGFLVRYTEPDQGLVAGRVGGTSASAPFWAASMALTLQLAQREGIARLGTLNPTLYQIAAEAAPGALFHDIIRGGNLLHQATPGWDYSTGWGSPRVAPLARAIVDFLRGI